MKIFFILFNVEWSHNHSVNWSHTKSLCGNFVLVPSTFKILYSLELMGRVSFTRFTRSFVLTSPANLFRKLAIAIRSRMSSILKFARAFKTRNYLSYHGT